MPIRVALITPADLAARLADSAVDAPGAGPTEDDCAWSLAVATDLVRGWTHGRGIETSFPPEGGFAGHQPIYDFVIGAAPEVASVIALVAARLAPNAEQATYRSISEEGFGGSVRGAFGGLTLHEQIVLAPWRRRLGFA